MRRRNAIALIFAIISGALLIITGYTGVSTGFWGFAIQIAISLNPNPITTGLLIILLSILTFLSFLGGWTILIGSVLLLLQRHRSAFYLIGIGAGLSLMGLIWNLAQMWLIGSLDLATFLNKYQGLSWAGAILAIIAQELIIVGKDQDKEEATGKTKFKALREETPDRTTSLVIKSRWC